MLMSFNTLVFYMFAVITVLAALRVITARNPVHAALFLVLAFCSSAGIWILLEAEFLAITLVLVYVGAEWKPAPETFAQLLQIDVQHHYHKQKEYHHRADIH